MKHSSDYIVTSLPVSYRSELDSQCWCRGQEVDSEGFISFLCISQVVESLPFGSHSGLSLSLAQAVRMWQSWNITYQVW